MNRISAPHHTMSEATENLTRYFSGCNEVSSVFVRPTVLRSSDGAEVAVLVKDAGLDAGALARLEARYTRVASSWGLGPVRVEVLNTAPASQQYLIVKDWTVIFERNRSFRTWFFEQAAGVRRTQAMAF